METDSTTLFMALSMLAIAIFIGLFMVAVKIGTSLFRNQHLQFRDDDYRNHLAYDRRNNRIIPVRALTKRARTRIL